MPMNVWNWCQLIRKSVDANRRVDWCQWTCEIDALLEVEPKPQTAGVAETQTAEVAGTLTEEMQIQLHEAPSASAAPSRMRHQNT